MPLLTSISGLRGTIGVDAEGLHPPQIVRAVSAFASWCKDNSNTSDIKIVVGRDARPSGKWISSIVESTLVMMGVDVLQLDLATTPTTEMAVRYYDAHGGIVITASHNPIEWNALKFLNRAGEVLSPDDFKSLAAYLDRSTFGYARIDSFGHVYHPTDALDHHICAILSLPIVRTEAIRKRKFRIVVDAINSVGASAVPALLRALHCDYDVINATMDGRFAHNPEPLPEHLHELCQRVKEVGADLGIAVDPDVDRLVFIDEHGHPFNEEYTLVAAADYVLSQNSGNTVSNLSSTQALRDITMKYGGSYAASRVGEANVIQLMKETNAIIGGEGNGGVIYPPLHYGRDALVGIALVLSGMVHFDYTLSQWKQQLPQYVIYKTKMPLETNVSPYTLLNRISEKTPVDVHSIDQSDGIKWYFDDGWVHIRPSNTEPILRIYAEAPTRAKAQKRAETFVQYIQQEITEIANS